MNPQRKWGVVSFGVLLVATMMAPLQAGPYSAMYSFGDSLSDTGNAYLASGGAVPPAGYFNGRFSNGPLWIDHVSAHFGLSPLTPAIVPGGTNYAVAGATSGLGNSSAGSPNLLSQIGWFQANLGGGAADPSALFTICVGANDFYAGETNPANPVSNISQAIQILAGLGARRVLVLDTGLLGNTPRALTSLAPPQQAGLNALSAGFSTQLQTSLLGLKGTLGISIYMADVFATSQRVHANPAAYGFSNITDGAYLVGNYPAVGYLYWDDIHPTAAGHYLIGQRAISAIPEPSTVLLLVLGAGLVTLCRRGRRSA